jgi:nitrogen fixation protein FixH
MTDMAEMTGRKVLAITVSAFGVIIAVNFLLAYKAVSTFPGLEVPNSYVASQTFDADRAAHARNRPTRSRKRASSANGSSTRSASAARSRPSSAKPRIIRASPRHAVVYPQGLTSDRPIVAKSQLI